MLNGKIFIALLYNESFTVYHAKRLSHRKMIQFSDDSMVIAWSMAMAALITLSPVTASARGFGAPIHLDCTLTAADGKRSAVHYRLIDKELLQFDAGKRDYTGTDFAREPCAVTAARILCTRQTRAPMLPGPVVRQLEIERNSGAITLSVTGLVYAGFNAKGICVTGVDRTKVAA